MKKEKSKIFGSLSYQKIFFLITAFTSFSWLVLVLIDYEPRIYIFFLKFNDFLADFANAVWYSVDLDPYRSPYNKPSEHCGTALYFIVYWLFSGFLDKSAEPSHLAWQQPVLMNAILLYYMGIGSCIFLSLYEMKKGSRPVKFFTTFFLLFSAIFMFTVERGNIVILGFLLSLFFICNYNNDNKVIREISFIMLAIAAGIRVAPALLGVVLLFEKRWKEAARLVVYGLIFFIIPFFIVQPWGSSNLTDTLRLFIENMKSNDEAYKSLPYSCGFSSMFAPWIYNDLLLSKIERSISFIMSAVILISYPRQECKWKKLMALILVMIMLPQHSLRYNLIFLLPVIVMFLDEEKHRSVDVLYFLLFLSMLCPLYLGFNRSDTYFLPGGIMFILFFADSAALLINKFRSKNKGGNDGTGNREEGCPVQ
ncbi:MAG: glycosyltransferase 87 family protein [Oscillospiraceae bacterium]|nr:glycosyltransferase 87 family protein [Oscillospiraceae bacterium]